MAAIPLHQEIEYPTADGQPAAAETRADKEAAARRAAEERLRLLEEELARLRRV